MSKFIDKNRKLSETLYKMFPHSKIDIHSEYICTIKDLISTNTNQYIVDAGAGKKCLYITEDTENRNKLTIVGVDISLEELNYNNDLDLKIVADITKEIPLPNGCANLVTSHSVMEHLKDTEGFIKNSYKLLNKDGYFIASIPCKFALFAILNQMLPQKISRILLDKFTENPEALGYKAYYNKCYHSEIIRLLKKYNFDIINETLSYRASDYFSFFVPIFILSALYEFIIASLHLKNLSSGMLIVAKKK